MNWMINLWRWRGLGLSTRMTTWSTRLTAMKLGLILEGHSVIIIAILCFMALVALVAYFLMDLGTTKGVCIMVKTQLVISHGSQRKFLQTLEWRRQRRLMHAHMRIQSNFSTSHWFLVVFSNKFTLIDDIQILWYSDYVFIYIYMMLCFLFKKFWFSGSMLLGAATGLLMR